MIGEARNQVEELRESLRDESRPLPALVWALLAVLVSTSLFLTLRLLVVQRPGPEAAAGDRGLRPVLTPLPARGAPARDPGPGTPRPPASPGDFAALVEGWKDAWVEKDLERFLAHYAPTFAADGKDLAVWREQKARVFASPVPLDVTVEDVRASVHEAIAIVSFTQTYRSGDYLDRGTKTLYLLPSGGAWRIFFEDWKALP